MGAVEGLTAEVLRSLPLSEADRELVSAPRHYLYPDGGRVHLDRSCPGLSSPVAGFSGSVLSLLRYEVCKHCLRTPLQRDLDSLLGELRFLASVLPQDVDRSWLPDVVQESVRLTAEATSGSHPRLVLLSSSWPALREHLQRAAAELRSFRSSGEAQEAAHRLLALRAVGSLSPYGVLLPPEHAAHLPGLLVSAGSADPYRLSSERVREQVFSAWWDRLARTGSRISARSSASEVFYSLAGSSPSTFEQLPEHPSRPPARGESTISYLTALWRTRLESTFDGLERSWFDAFQRISSAARGDRMDLLLVRPARFDDLFFPVASTTFYAGSPPLPFSETVMLLHLPAVFAEALCASDRPGYLPESVASRHEGVPGDTPEVLETALKLWELNSSGPLGTFEKALAVARSIG